MSTAGVRRSSKKRDAFMFWLVHWLMMYDGDWFTVKQLNECSDGLVGLPCSKRSVYRYLDDWYERGLLTCEGGYTSFRWADDGLIDWYDGFMRKLAKETVQ